MVICSGMDCPVAPSGAGLVVGIWIDSPGNASWHAAGHYENTPMQHIVIFHGSKNDNFHLIFSSPEPKAQR